MSCGMIRRIDILERDFCNWHLVKPDKAGAPAYSFFQTPQVMLNFKIYIPSLFSGFAIATWWHPILEEQVHLVAPDIRAGAPGSTWYKSRCTWWHLFWTVILKIHMMFLLALDENGTSHLHNNINNNSNNNSYLFMSLRLCAVGKKSSTRKVGSYTTTDVFSPA